MSQQLEFNYLAVNFFSNFEENLYAFNRNKSDLVWYVFNQYKEMLPVTLLSRERIPCHLPEPQKSMRQG